MNLHIFKRDDKPSLKCCPLCGGTADYKYTNDQSSDEIGVVCTKCGLYLREPNDDAFYFRTHDEDGKLNHKAEKLIAARWNKRVS